MPSRLVVAASLLVLLTAQTAVADPVPLPPRPTERAILDTVQSALAALDATLTAQPCLGNTSCPVESVRQALEDFVACLQEKIAVNAGTDAAECLQGTGAVCLSFHATLAMIHVLSPRIDNGFLRYEGSAFGAVDFALSWDVSSHVGRHSIGQPYVPSIGMLVVAISPSGDACA
jgi:hypothetical protein